LTRAQDKGVIMRCSTKSLLAASILCVGIAQIASAADMPVRGAAYGAPPVPYFSWTGCFIGGHVGGMSAKKEWFVAAPDVPVGASYGGHTADSILGGAQAGCDYQFMGGFVVGVQGDYAWTDAEGSHVDLIFPASRDHSRIKSLASVTGRVGYAWDRLLGYVRGGGAWERDEYHISDIPTGATFATGRETRGGWTLGVGGEYAFTHNISAFIEYNHYDFGTRTVNFVDVLFGPFNVDIRERKDVIKGGLNWRFGGPVYAKY
jgi:outer membrane immunogenic protein